MRYDEEGRPRPWPAPRRQARADTHPIADSNLYAPLSFDPDLVRPGHDREQATINTRHPRRPEGRVTKLRQRRHPALVPPKGQQARVS